MKKYQECDNVCVPASARFRLTGTIDIPGFYYIKPLKFVPVAPIPKCEANKNKRMLPRTPL
jgi:hypothetical protein